MEYIIQLVQSAVIENPINLLIGAGIIFVFSLVRSIFVKTVYRVNENETIVKWG